MEESSNKPCRAVLIDDEPLVRDGLRDFLKAQADFTVIGEAGDGAAGVELIRDLSPDLVFLDVRMPEMDGLELLEALSEEERPPVVFVTAFDEYAVSAFEFDAIDYLQKPFDEERLEECLSRVRRRMLAPEPDGGAQDEPIERINRFLVRSRGRTLIVKAAEVDWIEADDNYVRLHVNGQEHLIREQIGRLEECLDGERFCRIHRSAIVNLERIKEIRPLRTGDCEVVLDTDTVVRMSRRYREAFEEWVSRTP